MGHKINHCDSNGTYEDERARCRGSDVSAWPPVLPAPPSDPAAPGPATLSVSMSIHSSFQNCYASSSSISLAVLIAPQSALIIGSLSPSVIGDRPSPSKTTAGSGGLSSFHRL